jgi:hypothetical protein
MRVARAHPSDAKFEPCARCVVFRPGLFETSPRNGARRRSRVQDPQAGSPPLRSFFFFHGHRARAVAILVAAASDASSGVCRRERERERTGPHRDNDDGGHTTASTTPTSRPLLIGPNCRLSRLLLGLSPVKQRRDTKREDRAVCVLVSSARQGWNTHNRNPCKPSPYLRRGESRAGRRPLLCSVAVPRTRSRHELGPTTTAATAATAGGAVRPRRPRA